MENSGKFVIDPEQFKDELAALKRINKQFISLRSWLVNVSLACLAFSITTFVQIKLSGYSAGTFLAVTSIACFIISAFLALFIRFVHEFSGLAADGKIAGPFLPKVLEIAKKSKDATAIEIEEFESLFGQAIKWQKELPEDTGGGDPYLEVKIVGLTFLILLVGLVAFLIFIIQYLL